MNKGKIIVAFTYVALAGCANATAPSEPDRMRLGCQMWGVKDFWEKDPEKGFARKHVDLPLV